MKIHKLKTTSILILNFALSFTIKSQDFDFYKFQLDSAYRREVINGKVKSVFEFSKRPTGWISSRGFRFDRLGRVTASYLPGYTGQSKATYEYNDKGKLIKRNHFGDNDTSKLGYWVDFEYDLEGNPVQETTSFYDANGKFHSDVTQMEILCSSKEKTVRKTTSIKGDMFRETTFLIDSSFKKYRFEVKIRKEEPVKENTDSHSSIATKTIRRLTDNNSQECEDIIEYSISNGEQTLTFFTSICTSYDKQKRKILIEKKIFVLGQQFDAFVTEKMSALTRDELQALLKKINNPQSLLQMLDDKKLKEAEKEVTVYKYNDSGLLSERTLKSDHHEGKIIQFNYNVKRELSEEVELSPDILGQIKLLRRTLYTYNNKGLVSNISYYALKEGTDEEILTGEDEYRFEYFK